MFQLVKKRATRGKSLVSKSANGLRGRGINGESTATKLAVVECDEGLDHTYAREGKSVEDPSSSADPNRFISADQTNDHPGTSRQGLNTSDRPYFLVVDNSREMLDVGCMIETRVEDELSIKDGRPIDDHLSFRDESRSSNSSSVHHRPTRIHRTSSSASSDRTQTSTTDPEKDSNSTDACVILPPMECICGASDEDNSTVQRSAIVSCEMCTARLHADCVNYDLSDAYRGPFLCPPCHVISVSSPGFGFKSSFR